MSAEHIFEISGATVTVRSIGNEYQPSDRAYRQRYAYVIAADGWEYVGDDIRSGCGADVDLKDAAQTLLSFLGACAESRQFGTEQSENWGLFPDHVANWAVKESDEISLLAEA